MSIYGALFSGISALAAQSQSLAIIADNIANVNTVGYKETEAQFQTLVTQSRSSTSYSPGGVLPSPRALIDQQGLLQASASATAISVTGNGYFVGATISAPTSVSGEYVFTRAGAFEPDRDGNLKNAAGYFLQGWAIDANGNIPVNRTDLNSLEAVNITNLTGSATATSQIDLAANLNASQTAATGYTAGDMAAENVTPGSGAAPHFERSIQIFDSQGGARTLSFGFLKTGANTWATEVYAEPASDVTTTNGLLGSGNITFNTDGSINTIPAALSSLAISWSPALGIANSTVGVNYGTSGLTNGLTQFEGAFSLISSDVNGAIFGQLGGVEISDLGIVTALFDNGARQNIYQLPIATFPNPNSLSNIAGNAYKETDDSGDFTLREAGVGGAGLIAPNSLETSTVDLAEEFTDMITTQRAYSAGARLISTADQMLEELIRIR